MNIVNSYPLGFASVIDEGKQSVGRNAPLHLLKTSAQKRR